MKYRVELHPAAVEELTEAFEWYEERSSGLGHRFIEAIDSKFAEIANHPDRHARKKAGFREVTMKVFPYVIIYEILPSNKVAFISYIFHTKRNPKLKYKRKP